MPVFSVHHTVRRLPRGAPFWLYNYEKPDKYIPLDGGLGNPRLCSLLRKGQKPGKGYFCDKNHMAILSGTSHLWTQSSYWLSRLPV